MELVHSLSRLPKGTGSWKVYSHVDTLNCLTIVFCLMHCSLKNFKDLVWRFWIESTKRTLRKCCYFFDFLVVALLSLMCLLLVLLCGKTLWVFFPGPSLGDPRTFRICEHHPGIDRIDLCRNGFFDLLNQGFASITL